MATCKFVNCNLIFNKKPAQQSESSEPNLNSGVFQVSQQTFRCDICKAKFIAQDKYLEHMYTHIIVSNFTIMAKFVVQNSKEAGEGEDSAAGPGQIITIGKIIKVF